MIKQGDRAQANYRRSETLPDDIARAGDEILGYLEGKHLDHAENARSYAMITLDWELIVERYLEILSGE